MKMFQYFLKLKKKSMLRKNSNNFILAEIPKKKKNEVTRRRIERTRLNSKLLII